MRAYLEGRGLPADLAVREGWYPTRLEGAPYLVVPATAEEPRNRFWQARALAPVEPRWRSPSGVRRGAAWVEVRPAAEPRGTVYVEGPMDALAAAAVGWHGVALLGALPPTAVLRAIARREWARPLVLVPDRDALVAWARVWLALPEALLLCLPPQWKDLAEMPAAERARWLEETGATTET